MALNFFENVKNTLEMYRDTRGLRQPGLRGKNLEADGEFLKGETPECWLKLIGNCEKNLLAAYDCSDMIKHGDTSNYEECYPKVTEFQNCIYKTHCPAEFNAYEQNKTNENMNILRKCNDKSLVECNNQFKEIVRKKREAGENIREWRDLPASKN